MLELGVCYYPEQWPEHMWARDAQRMVELGIDWVRIGEFSWSLIETDEGAFDWGWLDRAVQILGDAGLKIVMCTPTAAPPKWLVDKHPEILPVDERGNVRKFGARRHYCFSSDIYRQHAVRIATEYAKRYGHNPAVHAWQIDNEYGDHDTIHSYSVPATNAFQAWLERKYGTISALNAAWGTCFWSMTYNRFDQIELPNQLVEEPSPTHLLDYYRFASDEVVNFNRAQVEVLRQFAPNRPVTHNFMGHNTDFDHYDVGVDIDFASWDSYPMGALIYGPQNETEKAEMLRVGLPDQPAFNNDLYRHVGGGKAWIMEQQPGPVNWAAHNQSPQDGMIRLWSWLAYAHGIDVVCYFRWRQSKFAQEQYHAGLLLPNDEPDQAFLEVQQIARERESLPKTEVRQQAEVALVLDYPSRWAAYSLPQGKDYSSARMAMEWYSAFARQGIDVDIISPNAAFDGYKLILLPDIILDDPDLVQRLKASDAKIYLGPRTGSKTADMHIPDHLPPGSFSQLIDVKVTRVESLPPYAKDQVQWGNLTAPVGNWREHIQTSAEVLAHFTADYRDGAPALVGNEKCWYAAHHLQGDMMDLAVKNLALWVKVDAQGLPHNVRITRRGNLTFAFNFGVASAEVQIPDGATLHMGNATIPPYDVAIWSS